MLCQNTLAVKWFSMKTNLKALLFFMFVLLLTKSTVFLLFVSASCPEIKDSHFSRSSAGSSVTDMKFIQTQTHTHYINIKSTAIKTTGRRQCYPLSPFTTKQNNNVILKLWVSTSLTLFSVMILVSNNYKTQIINKTFMLQSLFHSFLCFKASSSLSPHMEVLFVLPKIRV